MSYGTGPRTVGYTIASEFYGYLMRLIDLGAIEGPLGSMRPNPRLLPVIDALHRVVAGGSVEIRVIDPGSPDVYNDLNRRLEAGAAEANAVNEKAGYYVTLTP